MSGSLTQTPGTGAVLAKEVAKTAGGRHESGYRQAAWRLFQVPLTPIPQRLVRVTWADTELEGTPFQSTRLPLPVVRPKGTH